MSLLLALLALQSAPARLPETIANPSFERGLEGWRFDFNVGGYRAYPRREVDYSPERAAEGRGWLEIDWASPRGTPPGAWFHVTTRIDARRYRGRTIAFSAAVRLPDHASGAAALTARAIGPGAGARHEQRLRATPTWRRDQLVFAVPRGAVAIELGFLVDGRSGELEADAVRIDILHR